MFNFKEHTTQLPNNFLGKLHYHLLLDFVDYPFLVVQIDNFGQYYLNYYLGGSKSLTTHVLFKISKEKLSILLAQEISVHDLFAMPESDFSYILEYNESGSVEYFGMLNSALISINNPISSDYEFDFEEDQLIADTDIKIKSIQRSKILIDVYLQSKELRASLKYWALKSFLIPFSELIRFSLLDQSNEYTPHTIDQKVNFGMNNLQIGSLSATLEVNYNPNLFGESTNQEDIIKLFNVIKATEQDDILLSLEGFQNKKIIAEYLKVLNVIIKHDASLNTKMATPDNYFIESSLDKTTAQKIKRIINDKIPNVEDVENVQGYLFELNFDKNNPSFSVHSSTEEYKYKGRIDANLVQSIGEKEFTFIDKEYLFIIHTLYTPESSKSPEKTIRTLLDIKEIEN